MKKGFIELNDKTRLGISKLKEWLMTKEADDLSGTVTESIKNLNYILIREYYTHEEQVFLNYLRKEYFKDGEFSLTKSYE
jgi:hypothetical protein